MDIGEFRAHSYLVMLLLTLFFSLVPFANADEETGYIQIRAEPGIRVFLDGVFQDVTNEAEGGLVLLDVPSGERELRFVLEGFLPQEATVNLRPGQVLVYDVGSFIPQLDIREEGEEAGADLAAEVGTLVVQCLPVECTIDIPTLGINQYDKTRDQFIAEGVPIGEYEGSIAAGGQSLPVTFGVCSDDTITLFARFLGADPGIEVRSEENKSFPACERVSLRIAPQSPMILPGEQESFTLEIEGLDPETTDFVWSATAGEIQGDGTSVTFIAPEAAGSYTLSVESADNSMWRNAVTIQVVPYSVDSFDVESRPAVSGEEMTFSWSMSNVQGGVNLTCTLRVTPRGEEEEYVINDCVNNTAQIHVSNRAGDHTATLSVSDGTTTVTRTTQVLVLEPTYITLSHVELLPVDTDTQTREVQFDMSWPESWRGPDRPTYVEAEDNWDAAWVFIKYRESGGPWQHATLRTSGHTRPAGAAIDTPSDGMGAFIYRDAPGYGTFDADGVRLVWDYGADGVADHASIDVSVFSLEMVYVPQGSFSLGTGGNEANHFRHGSSSDPFQVTAQDSISLGDADGQLNWSTGNNSGTPSGSTNPDFPTGYDAFYAMKYQITQGQYVNFLNTLTQAQADQRKHSGSQNRYAITGDAVGEYTTTLPFVALNYLSWPDGAAFADWAGLRPMTELEFEKAARGTKNPVPNEYAWGNTTITPATGLDDEGTMSERPIPVGANANYGRNITPQGPVRVGSFAAPGRNREQAGASYYGLMELSGNLWERTVTVGNAGGRAFAGSHGDGVLDSQGNLTLIDWPGTDASGAGFRGGSWSIRAPHLRVSHRSRAASSNANRYSRYGWRGVRSAP